MAKRFPVLIDVPQEPVRSGISRPTKSPRTRPAYRVANVPHRGGVVHHANALPIVVPVNTEPDQSKQLSMPPAAYHRGNDMRFVRRTLRLRRNAFIPNQKFEPARFDRATDDRLGHNKRHCVIDLAIVAVTKALGRLDPLGGTMPNTNGFKDVCLVTALQAGSIMC